MFNLINGGSKRLASKNRESKKNYETLTMKSKIPNKKLPCKHI